MLYGTLTTRKGASLIDSEELKSHALEVLSGNSVGNWTRPAPGLYPHQWLWDSCFVAIGLAATNPERASVELLSLARGQWPNGMMPHMIYSPHVPYRFEALLWGTKGLSPKAAKTSGITEPPVLAIAAEKVAGALAPKARAQFIDAMLPVLVNYHQWIYRERDPKNTGLAVCLHSWESGMDDSPYWTDAMSHLPKPPLKWRWLREYRPVRAEERAEPREIQRMVTLAHTIKKYRYDSAKIMEHSSVAIQDIVFNCVLAAANESLERLAEEAGTSLKPDLRDRFAPTRRAIEGLWDDETNQYYSRDYLTGQLIQVQAVSTFMPLFAGTASLKRAQLLRDLIVGEDGYNVPFPLPSVPIKSPFFEPRRYWRGPVWINMNWFVVAGLERYGFTEEAEWLRLHTLGLVRKSGFREYYNPLTGEGLGATSFSWTAALTLDLLEREPALESDPD